MIFSDETSICVEGRGSLYVRRTPNEKLKPCHLSQRQKFPQKQMFWACFSAYGVSPLHPCDGNINTAKYIGILESNLLPQASAWYEDFTSWTFMQDNAPCHVSKTTKKWIHDHGFQVMEWPPNSPDLNPIENMWGVLKQKLLAIPSQSKAELIENAKKIWLENPAIKSVCKSLTESMPKRVASVIKSKGRAIKY